ncbi:acetyltransferase (isoleucine patch superfamily)-like protein [Rhodococcus ruber BKS 20-38]|uniref:Acetyltransferase (Isoleucine patch superfamily)-like protein n=1 Tax=Rhodococcus ruber BKS 20-38 TaxID=1278076 RepID=M2XVT6_9NOCA|nr:CatB-related O-acetyltransferase [Rhodococcus ruber]EME53340.1 acetyltransferase (isoleucine patch superfamily)-like protein [Rhodococcus ruber BKS 20-38]
MRSKILTWISKLEGGDFYSATLRQILETHYGVEVGPYTYGSLLTPGYADRHTRIGSYVSIGPNVRRFGAAHPLDALSMHPFWYNPRLGYVDDCADVQRTSCEIQHDSWIGANVTILPGCRKIGVGAVIGAGSVVTSDVEPFTIVVGNPARPIGQRLTREIRNKLLELHPWSNEPAEFQRILHEWDITRFSEDDWRRG